MNIKKLKQIREVLYGIRMKEYMALKHFTQEERDEQRKIFFERIDEAIELQPDYYEVYLLKANFFVKEANIDKALNALDIGIKASNDARLYYRKAELLETQGKSKDALRQYNTVIQNDLDTGNSYPYYRFALKFKENLQGSILFCQSYFSQYNIKNADDLENKAPVFKLMLKNLIARNEIQQAKKEYDKIKQIKGVEKDFIDAFYLLITRKTKKALKLYKQALCYNPYHAEALYELGGYYSNEKKYKIAVEYLKRAIYVDENLLRKAKSDPDYVFLSKTKDFIKLSQKSSWADMLFVDQVKPFYTDWGFIKLKPDMVNQAKYTLLSSQKIHEESLFIHIVQSEDYKDEEFLEPKSWYLHLHHLSDKTHEGCHNILNIIKKLSPFLEDAYFFMRTCYETWVDEYKIQNGKLFFYRNYDVDKNYNGLNNFYKEKAKKKPKDKDIQYFVSVKYLDLGQKLVSKNLYKRIKDIKKTVLQYYDEAILYYPQNHKAYYHKGKLFQLIYDYKQAVQFFSKALEIKPDYPDVLFALGSYEYELGNYKQALEKYSELIKINKKYREAEYDNVDVYYYCALAYEKLGNYDKVLTNYNKSIELFPEQSYKAQFDKGNLLYDTGKFKEAVKSFDAVIKEIPNFAGAWFNKGLSLYSMEKYTEADKCYDKALELNPEHKQIWYAKAQVQFYISNFEKAIEYYDNELKNNPLCVYSWSAKGMAFNNLGKFEQAFICYKTAIESDPEYYHPYYGKACSYALTGDKEQALKMIEKAIKLAPIQKDMMKKEKDFNSLHDDKRFWDLLE